MLLKFYREKEKSKQRDDAWNKINTLAQDNPQVSLQALQFDSAIVC